MSRKDELIVEIPRELAKKAFSPAMNADGYNSHLSFASRCLEILLKDAVEVNGVDSLSGRAWTRDPGLRDTHKALLIDIQPIKKGVTKEEILGVLRRTSSGFIFHEMKEFADRIEKEGIIL